MQFDSCLYALIRQDRVSQGLPSANMSQVGHEALSDNTAPCQLRLGTKHF